MRVVREELLQCLEAVAVAATRTDEFRQSSCLAFAQGRVMAFDGDVACSSPSPLNGVRGAVRAGGVLEYLRKHTADEVEVTGDGERLFVKDGEEVGRFAMDKEVLLPVEQIEPPENWLPLHEDFCEAAQMVSACCGTDKSQFDQLCVHVTPKWVEAWDGQQILRYRITTPVKENFLCRAKTVKQAATLGMTHVSETPNWVHFKNPSGTVASSLRYLDVPFHDMTALFKFDDAVKMQVPKGLAEACLRAGLFTKECRDEDVLEISLSPGSCRIVGRGITCDYDSGPRKVSYDGPAVAFRIKPELLAKVSREFSHCHVAGNRLVVDGGKWRYVVRLSVME